MKTVLRIVLLVALAGLLVWAYRQVFPNQEARIRRMFHRLAELVSIPAHASPLDNLKAAHALGRHVTPDVEVQVTMRGLGRHTLTGREEIKEATLAARAHSSSVKVEVFDIQVRLGPSKQTAVVELTARITQPAERDVLVQELRFDLVRVDRDWQIRRVETIPTLRP